MGNNLSNKLLACHQKAFDELYVIDTLVKLTQKSCQDYEFSGQYYDISKDRIAELSMERNNYINMLNIISERISNIMQLNLTLEREISLQQDTYNRSRKITAERSANQGS